jgi:GTP-binding protein
LIEGAHLGKGLGDRFLRHVERTKVLIHLIDGAGLDGRAPHDDYEKLNRELSLYSAELMEKPQVIALNKMDLTSAAENMRKFKSRSPRKKVFPVSALTGSGVKELLREVWAKLREV